MATDYPEVTFVTRGLTLSGKLYVPQGKGPFPALLIYHGYKGCRQSYGGLARQLVAQGMAVFAFNFSGCGRGNSWSEGQIEDQTIADQSTDALAAYDWLAKQAVVDPQRIAVFGRSLGAYCAACVSSERNFAALFLAAPAIYADEWQARTVHSLSNQELWSYRSDTDLTATQPLQALAQFKGDVLVVQHSQDEQMPSRVAKLYYEAASQARSRELRVLEAPHRTTPAAKQQTEQWISAWVHEKLLAV